MCYIVVLSGVTLKLFHCSPLRFLSSFILSLSLFDAQVLMIQEFKCNVCIFLLCMYIIMSMSLSLCNACVHIVYIYHLLEPGDDMENFLFWSLLDQKRLRYHAICVCVCVWMCSSIQQNTRRVNPKMHFLGILFNMLDMLLI